MSNYASFVPHYDPFPHALFEQVARDCKDTDTLVEVGAFLGHGTCYMAECLAAYDKRPRFVAIDVWDQTLEPVYGENRGPDFVMPWGSSLAEFRGSGGRLYDSFRFYLDHCPNGERVFDHCQFPPLTCMDEFADGSVGFVYLGYSTKEEDIDREVKAWWAKLRSGGQIAIAATKEAPLRAMIKA